MGEFWLVPRRVKPAGSAVTWSPWLIHTGMGDGRPAASGSAESDQVTSAGPYSRARGDETCPPAARASNCMP
jgi:hypothetical protein